MENLMEKGDKNMEMAASIKDIIWTAISIVLMNQLVLKRRSDSSKIMEFYLNNHVIDQNKVKFIMVNSRKDWCMDLENMSTIQKT